MKENLEKLLPSFTEVQQILNLKKKKLNIDDFCSIVQTIDSSILDFFNYENLLFDIDNNIKINEEEISRERKYVFKEVSVVSNGKTYLFSKQTTADEEVTLSFTNINNSFSSSFSYSDYMQKRKIDTLDKGFINFLYQNSEKTLEELIKDEASHKREKIFKYNSLKTIEELNNHLDSMNMIYKIKFQFEKLLNFEITERIKKSKDKHELILFSFEDKKYYQYDCKVRKMSETVYMNVEIVFKKEVQRKTKTIHYWG